MTTTEEEARDLAARIATAVGKRGLSPCLSWATADQMGRQSLVLVVCHQPDLIDRINALLDSETRRTPVFDHRADAVGDAP